MTLRVPVLCSLVLGSASLMFGQSAAPVKVGIINIQQAIIGTRDGQAAAKELEGKSAPKKKELEGVQSEIRSMQDKLNKMSSVGSEDEKRKLMGDIEARTKSFNRMVEDAQSELDQEQSRILNELGGRIYAVLTKYGQDNGFAMILDISAQNTPVLFAANSIDVTQDIIALYDKNAPGTTPAGAAGAKPPAATTKPATTAPGTAAPAAKPPAAAPKPAGAK